MTETETTQRRSRTPIVIAVLVVIVIALAAVVIVQMRSSANPAPSPTAKSSSSSSATTSAASSSLEVAVGGGGSGVAKADRTTPVGYNESCTGAVAAATNYSIALDATRIAHKKDPISKDQFRALTKELIKDNAYRFELESQMDDAFKGIDGVKKTGYEGNTITPQWGGFKVQSCSAGEGARISVFGAAGTDGTYSYGTETYDMTWDGDDWKLTDIPDLDVADPVKTPDEVTKADPSIPREISQVKGWEAYTNAPK